MDLCVGGVVTAWKSIQNAIRPLSKAVVIVVHFEIRYYFTCINFMRWAEHVARMGKMRTIFWFEDLEG